MITETILSKFRNNVVSEGLHLQHGTKSAKIVCHVDLDGVTSGISMVQSLVKQGIPKERITVEFAQYGDEKKDKEFSSRFEPKNKSQFIGVTDFAKLQKCKPFDIFNKLMNFKADREKFVNFFKSRDFSKISLPEFDKLIKETFDIEIGKWTAGNIKELYKAMKAYYTIGDKAPKFDANNIANLEYQISNPDFVSDHHSNEDGALSSGKRGEIATGSKSEAEFFANKYVPGIWDQSDLKAISAVDSAEYTEEDLKNTIFLQKHFTGPDRKKNLAIIISTIYDNMVKKDKRAAKYVILNANPMLVSLYTTTLKAANMSKEAEHAFNLLKKGEVKEASEIMKSLPKIFNKHWTDNDTHKDIKPIMDLKGWQEKNTKDLENAKTGYKTRKDEESLEEVKGKRSKEAADLRNEIKSKKGKLVQHSNFTLFNGKDKKTQYSRYMSSLYSVNGKRTPFVIRYWDSFFQVAKNPLYKGEVDFSIVGNHVIEEIASFLKSKGLNDIKIKNITDVMKKENGGHKGGIWSFQGFDGIKPTSKEYGDYFDKKSMLDKANKLNLNLPKTQKAFDEKENGVVAKYKKIKQDCIEMAIASVIKWTNKLYPPSEENLEPLKNNDSRFEGK